MSTILDLLASQPLLLDECTIHPRSQSFTCKFPLEYSYGMSELSNHKYIKSDRQQALWAGVWYEYQGNRYLMLSMPGWKMETYGPYETPPNEVLWWNYQLQRVHCTLAQSTFFRGNSKKGYNLHYLIKDMAFVDHWIWEASSLLQCNHLDAEIRQFTQQLLPIFQSCRTQEERDQLRDNMLDTMHILDVNEYDESSLRGIIQETIIQQQWTDREELSLYF